MSTVTIVQQRNRNFYQSICKTVQMTYKELFAKFKREHDKRFHGSWGTFIVLRPFYVRHNPLKDIEMRCCKLHLHTRWSINTLVDCCKKQVINVGVVENYDSFFKSLTSKSKKDDIAL